MVIEELKKVLNEKHEIKFKLYSLEYMLKKMDNKISIYPLLYETKKSYFDSLEEALMNYTIYNENIIENIERLIIIK